MDAVVNESIAKAQEQVKTSVAWSPDQPHPQSIFQFIPDQDTTSNHEPGKWLAQDRKDLSLSSPSSDKQMSFDQISIMSWNIDFMLPFPNERMKIALDHLHKLHSTNATTHECTATIIFLAECLQSDLQVIASHPWIQQNFFITDLDDQNWQNGYYGTTTLIDRRLNVVECFRIHYSLTRMQRDALFVDIDFVLDPREKKPTRLRFCNTHLESLALEPAYRPPQLKICAEWMNRENVHAAILAGDLNAIQPFDRTLHSDNGLRDAFLESKGSEDDPKGHTWGQQATTAMRAHFGTSRMDKVLYRGSLELRSFELFGQGVELDDSSQRESIVLLGFDQPWITDHYGVKALFKISAPVHTML